MAIPPNVSRIVMEGTLPGGEIWSSGFWIQGETPTSNAEANALAELWWNELTAATDPAPVRYMAAHTWSNQMAMTAVRTYCYPAGGPHAAFVGEHTGSWPGSAGNTLLPNQVAMVMSLRTGNAGRRNRGRMYLPCNASQLGTDGQFGEAVCQNIVDSWAQFFSDWNASGDNGTVAVVSSAATQAHPVTQVIIDSRPDIQRRRANRQAIDSRSQAVVTSS